MLLEACYKRGVAPPESIQNAPDLLLGLGLYFEAFLDLSADRGFTDRIPWSVMRQYAAWLELDDAGFERFVYLIKQMDEERAEVLKGKSNVGDNSGKPGPVQRKDR